MSGPRITIAGVPIPVVDPARVVGAKAWFMGSYPESTSGRPNRAVVCKDCREALIQAAHSDPALPVVCPICAVVAVLAAAGMPAPEVETIAAPLRELRQAGEWREVQRCAIEVMAKVGLARTTPTTAAILDARRRSS